VRVAWVHPSWRDLVIEHLASSPAERRAFLAAAEVPGLELALSIGGGERGERELPLVVDDADWDALGDAVHRVCHEGAPGEAARVLGALGAALAATGDDRALAELVAVARMALETSRRRAASTAWDAETLERWMALRVQVPAPPPEPDLMDICAAGRPESVDLDDPVSVHRLDGWLAVREVLVEFHSDGAGLEWVREQDRPLVAGFLSAVEALGRPLTEPEASVVGRVIRLDVQFRLRADALVVPVRTPPEPWQEMVRPKPLVAATGQRIRRILRDL
jgi:hypothetical protein